MAKKRVAQRKRKTPARSHYGLGIASAISGVISLLTFIFAWPAILFGISALVLGVLQIKHQRTLGSIIGLITGTLGLVLGILVMFAVVFIIATNVELRP